MAYCGAGGVLSVVTAAASFPGIDPPFCGARFATDEELSGSFSFSISISTCSVFGRSALAAACGGGGGGGGAGLHALRPLELGGPKFGMLKTLGGFVFGCKNSHYLYPEKDTVAGNNSYSTAVAVAVGCNQEPTGWTHIHLKQT